MDHVAAKKPEKLSRYFGSNKTPPSRTGLIIGIPLVFTTLVLGLTQSSAALAQSSTAQAQSSPALLEDEKNTIDVFKQVSPSVVFITSLIKQTNIFSFNISEVPKGSGSGFIWDTNGHIVTNYHVVANASAWKVAMPGSAKDSLISAKIVGADPYHDLAVLKISLPSDKLKPVQPGSSDALQVGQKVLAIGNPFGFDQSLTRGIVSALGREIKSENNLPIFDVIQTDASINPGNSGGPLLDSSGKLIGVNTAIYSPTGASAGIGFAIPANTVKRIVPQLIEKGRVTRVGIGVQLVPDHIAKANNLHGAVIWELTDKSLEKKSGLRGLSRTRNGQMMLGDIIIAIDGKSVNSRDDLFSVLDNKKAGDEVTLTVVREDKKREVKITLKELT